MIMTELLMTGGPRVAAILAMRQAQREKAQHHRNYRQSVVPAITAARRLTDGEWAGQPCFIIGGGESLKRFDFGRLCGAGRIIAINRAFESIPFADIIFFMDQPYYEDIMQGKYGQAAIDKWKAFQGRKVFLNLSGYRMSPDIISVSSLGLAGPPRPLAEGIYHGNNSGAGAISLAVALGANPIYLLGYDCKGKHFHDGYGGETGDRVGGIFANSLTELAKQIGISHRILNLNPDSASRAFPFGDVDKILKASGPLGKWIAISFYTAGTGYEQEVNKLIASLKTFKLPHHVFSFNPTGTWRGNLNFKSESILKGFDMFPGKDIVFIDADGIVRQYPTLFDELSSHRRFDLSAHFFKYDPKSGDPDELLSGTLWIQNNETGRALVKRWHEVGLARPDVRHQMCLKVALEDLAAEGLRVRVNRHPFAYTCIFDYYMAQRTSPVIEHFQKSRQLRKQVGYGQRLAFRREQS